MKRFLFLLVLLGGGVAWAAFAVPTNAAVVNGVTISQQQLNSDVSTIANSPSGLYGCFLNAEEVVATNGQTGLPAINGVAPASSGATRTVATTAFTAAYLDTVIGHQVVFELAAQRHLVVTAADRAAARLELMDQITAIMQDVSGSPYACAASGVAVTGNDVIASMPSSFIDREVQFDATVSVLEETVAGVGSSTADLERYFAAHRSLFDTASFTVADYTTAAQAQAAAAQVAGGTPFAQVAAQAPGGGGPQGTSILYGITQQLPAGTNLQSLALNTVSKPISYNGSYLLVEITARTPTAFAQAKSEVQGAVQSVGSAAAQRVIQAAEAKATVTVDPRYGTWTPKTAQTIPPVPPLATDVLNAAANAPSASAASAPAATTTPTTTPSGSPPATGQAG